MKKLFTLLAVLGICSFAIAQNADDIINKHFEATGGKDKWAKVVAIKYEGKYIMGPGMEAPLNETLVTAPFKGYYSDFSWQGMTSKQALKDGSGWNYNPFGGKREADPMSANEVRSILLSADPQGLLFNYKEKGFSVDYLGMDDMDGSDVFKLRLTTKDGDMVYYYIDAETYYILKIAKRIKLADKEEKSQTTFSDFRPTAYGVIVPYSYQNLDEEGNEQGGPVKIENVEVNFAVKTEMFEAPVKK
jgi:hypothetical protein